MAIKAFVTDIEPGAYNGNVFNLDLSFYDTSTDKIFDPHSSTIAIASLPTYTLADFRAAFLADILDYANNIAGYGISASDIIWGAPNALAPLTFANPSRSLNSAFQVSSIRDSLVSYAVDIAATLSLTTGQTGTVTLQYADNSGMSTNLVNVNSASNGNTGTLTLGLNLVQTATATVSGVIPAGKYVRLATANTTGTPTFTFRSAQEVLL